MKCKCCQREIPENSIFCNWCGESQIKKKKQKDEIKIPKATQLKSGKWNIYLRAENQSVTEDTEELCKTKARAIRAGFIEKQKHSTKIAFQSAAKTYIQANDAILSPSTLRGYEEISRNRFKMYHESDLASVNWAKAINEEAKLCSPKTVRNAWGLVAKLLRFNGLEVPSVNLPQVPPHELAWLDYDQIQIFVKAVYGQPCEMAALLALHSLRRSELLAITPSKTDASGIHVIGARVLNKDGELIEKQTNKNSTSTRVVPIMIPRLQELVDASDKEPDEAYVDIRFNKVYNHINTVCRHVGLPEVGIHGLRRSFASLAYHLGWQERKTMAIGGWKDWQTMHKMYIKLAEDDLKEAADSMREFYKFTDKITDESEKD